MSVNNHMTVQMFLSGPKRNIDQQTNTVVHRHLKLNFNSATVLLQPCGTEGFTINLQDYCKTFSFP